MRYLHHEIAVEIFAEHGKYLIVAYLQTQRFKLKQEIAGGKPSVALLRTFEVVLGNH